MTDRAAPPPTPVELIQHRLSLLCICASEDVRAELADLIEDVGYLNGASYHSGFMDGWAHDEGQRAGAVSVGAPTPMSEKGKALVDEWALQQAASAAKSVGYRNLCLEHLQPFDAEGCDLCAETSEPSAGLPQDADDRPVAGFRDANDQPELQAAIRATFCPWCHEAPDSPKAGRCADPCHKHTRTTAARAPKAGELRALRELLDHLHDELKGAEDDLGDAYIIARCYLDEATP